MVDGCCRLSVAVTFAPSPLAHYVFENLIDCRPPYAAVCIMGFKLLIDWSLLSAANLMKKLNETQLNC